MSLKSRFIRAGEAALGTPIPDTYSEVAQGVLPYDTVDSDISALRASRERMTWYADAAMAIGGGIMAKVTTSVGTKRGDL